MNASSWLPTGSGLAGQLGGPGGAVGEYLLSTGPVCVIVHQGISHAQWCAHFLITCGMRMTVPRPVDRNGCVAHWPASPASGAVGVSRCLFASASGFGEAAPVRPFHLRSAKARRALAAELLTDLRR